MKVFEPKKIAILALFVMLVAYALFQARFIISGPIVSITSHHDGEVVDEPVIVIEGEARNISKISLNDRQIFTDEKGLWSEKLIVSPGASIMTVKVSDRFGREITKHIQIILPTPAELNTNG